MICPHCGRQTRIKNVDGKGYRKRVCSYCGSVLSYRSGYGSSKNSRMVQKYEERKT